MSIVKEKREEAPYMISGILVIWMMVYHIFHLAHMTESLFYKYALFFFFFFMPWFYFKSGMFFKFNMNVSFVKYVRKCFYSLIIPMMVWFSIGYIIKCPESIIIDNKPLWKIAFLPVYHFLHSGDTPGNDPLWFLLSLFLVKILFFLIIKIKYYYILIPLLLPLGILASEHSVILPLAAHTIPIGLFFCFLGYVYGTYNNKMHNVKNLIILPTLFFILFNILFASYVDIHFNRLIYGDYMSFVTLSLLAIMIVIYTASRFKSNFLTWTGENSIYFLVLHWPIFYLIKYGFYIIRVNPVGEAFALALLLIGLPICMITPKILKSNTLLFGR